MQAKKTPPAAGTDVAYRVALTKPARSGRSSRIIFFQIIVSVTGVPVPIILLAFRFRSFCPNPNFWIYVLIKRYYILGSSQSFPISTLRWKHNVFHFVACWIGAQRVRHQAAFCVSFLSDFCSQIFEMAVLKQSLDHQVHFCFVFDCQNHAGDQMCKRMWDRQDCSSYKSLRDGGSN